MLEEVKRALRITTCAFDTHEILPLIAACKRDLHLAGVNRIDEDDPLVRRAVVLYCKAHFGEGNEKFERAYKALRDSMALSGDYGTGAD